MTVWSIGMADFASQDCVTIEHGSFVWITGGHNGYYLVPNFLAPNCAACLDTYCKIETFNVDVNDGEICSIEVRPDVPCECADLNKIAMTGWGNGDGEPVDDVESHPLRKIVL